MISGSAIILCGGKGRRLGSMGERIPKPLAPVQGHPILWFSILRLHKEGYRHFILPLGFLGHEIRRFVEEQLCGLDAEIECIDTGEDSPVGKRLSLVRHAVRGDNVLLVNGDTLFDFDITDMVEQHQARGASLTLSSCQILSQYGLIIVNETGEVIDFARDSKICEFVVSDKIKGQLVGFVNAGIAMLRREALDLPGIEISPDFEKYLYPHFARKGDVCHHEINGFWYAIDTLKDLEIANADTGHDSRCLNVRSLTATLTDYAKKIGLPADGPRYETTKPAV
jgi:glucose-1-phosphate cytidylyltransferase